jgi:uncharacterized YccA/Bax inhibitor family protein
MQSKNPVFARREEFARNGQGAYPPGAPQQATFGQPPTQWSGQQAPYASPEQLDDLYGRPAAGPAQTGRMTYDDVVVRTGILFAILLTTAAATWFLLPAALLFPVAIGSMLLGLGVGLVIAFSKVIRPPLMMVYAGIEGVFLGAISFLFEGFYNGIIIQAVLATLGAFTAMLFAYKIGAIRATPKFTRFLIIATIGYMVFQLFNLVAVLVFGVPSVYSMGLLGIAISLFGVGLASLNLILDFDYIDRGVRQGLPQQYAWLAAYGLVVTLVWLYIEMLRVISILRGNN